MPSHTKAEREKTEREAEQARKAEEKKPEFSPDVEAARGRTAGASAQQLEAQRISEQAFQSPFSQQDIDTALTLGINIFRGVNLSRISRGEQATQAARNTGAEAVEGVLASEQNQTLDPRPLLDPAVNIGLATQDAARKIITAIPRLARLGDKGIQDIEKGSDFIVSSVFKGISFGASKLPFGLDVNTINNIIAANKQIVIDSRETGTIVVSNVRIKAYTPEEGLSRISGIEDSINQSEAAIHIASRFSLKAFLEGLGAEEAKLIKAREQLVGSRNEILVIAAQQAAGKLSTGEEILASLT